MRGAEQSRIVTGISGWMRSLLSRSMKYYGMFFISLGLSCTLATVLKLFLHGGAMDLQSLAVGIITVVAALLMLFSEATLAEVVCGSRIAGLLLFGFLKLRREELLAKGESSNSKGYIAFAVGILLGLLTVYIDPILIFVALIGVFVMYAVLASPEAGVVIMIAALPFLTTMMLVGVMMWTVLSYLIKLARGKRNLKLEFFDTVLICFAVLLLFGGLVSVSPASSMKAALVFICFIFGFFLAVNLINTPRLLRLCLNAMLLSASVVALYGILQYITGSAQSLWQDTEMFSDIAGRVVSTFANPNVLAEYLIMMLPFAASMMITAKEYRMRVLYFISFALLGLCLVFTWSRGAWLGFMIAAVIFMLIWSRRFMVLALFGVIAVPFLPAVLPSNIVSRFTSIGNLGDSSTSYRVNIWRGVMNMLRDHFVTGIGIGEGAFSLVYPNYAYAGIDAPHSHNLFLQITAEMGIVGLAVFLLLIFLFVRGSLRFVTKPGSLSIRTGDDDRASFYRLTAAAGFCGILGIILQGMTDYVWYNYRVYLMFWLVIGLSAAVRRIADSEMISLSEIM